MARLFQSGFELNSNTLGVEFASTSGTVSIVTTSPRSGARHGRVLNGTGSWRSNLFGSDQAAVGFHSVAIQIKVAPNVDTVLIGAVNTSNVFQGYITLNTDRTLSLFKADDTQIGSDSAPLDLDAWYVVEIKNDATGSGALEARYKKDGASGWTTIASGANSSQGTWSRSVIGNAGFAPTTNEVYFDDWKVNDGTGSSQNSWPGDGKIIHLRPNAGGDNNGWQTNSGAAGTSNNYTLVDETPPNDATDFVRSRTTNDIDDYNVEDSGIASQDIVNVVAVGFRATRSTGTNSSSVVARLKAASSGTVAESGAETATNAGYRTNDLDTNNAAPLPLVSYTKPGTSDPWTQTDLDAMQIGVRCSSGSGDRYVHVTALWASIDYLPVTNVSVGTTVQSVVAALVAASVLFGATIGPAVQAAALSLQAPTVSTESGLPKVEELTDDFDDNSLDTDKWTDWGGAQTSETNNRLELSSTLAAGYYGIDSADRYDLSDSAATIEVVDAGNQSLTSLEVYPLQLSLDTDNYVLWLITGGTLFAYKKVAGSSTNLASVTYNSVTHRYLRIREDAGTTYWEYSADGSSWSTLHSESDPFDISDVAVTLLLGTWQTEASTTTAVYDNLNVAGTAVTVNPGVQTAAYSIQSPTVVAEANTSVSAGVQSASFSTQAHTITADQVITAAVQQGTFSIQSPSVALGSAVTANAQAVIFSLPAASVTFGVGISPSAQAVTANLPAATTQTGVTIGPSAQAGTFNLISPTVSTVTSVTIAADIQAATLMIQSPMLSAAVTESAAVQAATVSLQSPAVQASATASAEVQTLTLTTQDVTVSADSAVTINPATQSVVMASQPPGISTGVLLQPNPQSGSFSFLSPGIETSANSSFAADVLQGAFSAPVVATVTEQILTPASLKYPSKCFLG